jgi:hypothetical protein
MNSCELYERHSGDIEDEIIEIRATSLDGMRAKAELIFRWALGEADNCRR